MKRDEFVRAFAQRSGLSDEWADIGVIDVGGRSIIALPCACGHDSCEGWAMVGSEGVLHHLQFDAPEALRDAYMRAVSERERGEE